MKLTEIEVDYWYKKIMEAPAEEYWKVKVKDIRAMLNEIRQLAEERNQASESIKKMLREKIAEIPMFIQQGDVLLARNVNDYKEDLDNFIEKEIK